MVKFIIQLVVLLSINSLRADGALTEFYGDNLQQLRTFPCPEEADIAPCICIYNTNTSQLTLDCTDITSDEELANIFKVEFPVTDLWEFKMNSSSALTALNFTCGGVKFQRFSLSLGPFPSLVEVSDVFYESCADADLESVVLSNTELSSFVFPPPPLSDKIIFFEMYYSNLASIPAISSDSLTNLYLQGSQISQIVPGTFDDIPNLRNLQLDNNNIKILESDSIPFTYNGNRYSFYNNGLETIEPGAFDLIGEPALNSLEILLYNNLLKTVDASVFGLLMPYVDELNISGNPLDCICDIAWIILNPDYLAKVTNSIIAPRCADGTLLTDLDPVAYEQFC